MEITIYISDDIRITVLRPLTAPRARVQLPGRVLAMHIAIRIRLDITSRDRRQLFTEQLPREIVFFPDDGKCFAEFAHHKRLLYDSIGECLRENGIVLEAVDHLAIEAYTDDNLRRIVEDADRDQVRSMIKIGTSPWHWWWEWEWEQ